ncbi:MAG: dihydrolipoamide acetyltransferase family protein [Acidobacteriota bacterium]
MPVPVIIPKATLSMEEGVLAKWLKNEGEVVVQGEPLFELETDKAVAEIESPANGTLLRISIPEGSVKVEQIVAWIGQPGEQIDELASGSQSSQMKERMDLPVGHPCDQVAERPTKPASPAARRRAKELGVEITDVTGTGPGGRVTAEDVEKQQEMRAKESAPSPAFEQKRSAVLIRKVTRSWQSAPHIHVARHMSAEGLVLARPLAKRLFSPEVSYTDLILFALSKVVPRFPPLLTIWSGEELVGQDRLNLAFAVDTESGVVAPVIHGIAELDMAEICSRRRQLAEAARSRQLTVDQVGDGTFTLTNLGMEDVDFFAPILNAPQSAILAVGRISQEPIAIEGRIEVGWRVWVNVALDHRVADGVVAGRFLSQLQAFFDTLPHGLRRPSHP